MDDFFNPDVIFWECLALELSTLSWRFFFPNANPPGCRQCEQTTTKKKPNNNKKMMMKSSLNDEVDKEITEDVSNDVDSMNEAARIRIIAGSSPPWVASELVTHALKYIDFFAASSCHWRHCKRPFESCVGPVSAILASFGEQVSIRDGADSSRRQCLVVALSSTINGPLRRLWHCHRLSTDRYEAYCHRRFGHIMECQAPQQSGAISLVEYLSK